ncbi:YheC/YheD family protein [Desulfofalx alkaliphila]|uniref:YheC/YheD family protein n=1 Tax=Desulfofalx alkaliphila TaxID=105483 RepID=UPI0004E22CF9|nr:YheC/YheD family protein [Desulfofalx alkaliphila]
MYKFQNKTKYQRYLQLSKSKVLEGHLPATDLFSPQSFADFIKKYNTVILKPAIGSRGAGVFKISSLGKNTYQVHTENTTSILNGIKETTNYFKENKKPCPYMVQQWVPLAEHEGKPMDFRVMVQRKKTATPWTVTGKLARLAGPGYIVTNNKRSKATVLTPLEALKLIGVDSNTGKNLLMKIDNIALEAAKQLTKYRPNHRVWGLDMGVDQDNHIWIIEANNAPMIISFKDLNDQGVLKLIKQYKDG